jgi:hypothetical protein
MHGVLSLAKCDRISVDLTTGGLGTFVLFIKLLVIFIRMRFARAGFDLGHGPAALRGSDSREAFPRSK